MKLETLYNLAVIFILGMLALGIYVILTGNMTLVRIYFALFG